MSLATISKQPALEVTGLTTRLRSDDGWVHALDDLSLCVEQGKTFALVGESGCGKSMTALSIARLLPESGAVIAGSVRLDHDGQLTDTLLLPERLMRTIRGRRVSLIFQEPGTSLNPVMTVGEQITEVILTHQSMSVQQAMTQAAEWLSQVGLDDPTGRLAQYPFQLSGGQKQRVMIAIALAARPDILIADEPTTALDVSVQAQVLDLLKSLQHKLGMAMVLITHDLGIVSRMADHVALMYAGQIVESSPTRQFFVHPQHPYAKALLAALPDQHRKGELLMAIGGQVPSLSALPPGCRFASRCPKAVDDCQLHMPELSAMGDDRWVRCFYPEAPPVLLQPAQGLAHSLVSNGVQTQATIAQGERQAAQSPLLVVQDLSVSYRQSQGLLGRSLKPVLKGLSMTIRPGQTVALVGESGSGKTTAAKAILQLLGESAVVSGRVMLAQQDMQAASGERLRQLRRTVQVVFQDPFASLNPRHRVREIIREGLDALCPYLSEADKDQRIAQVLESVSLPAKAALRFPHEFSGGQRQRIAIARALAVEPQLLVCDEPTSALDVSVQAQVLNLLLQLQRERGLSYLFITHNLAVVEYMADDIVVLRQGEVVEQGPAATVLQAPRSAYTRSLLAAVPRI